MLGTASPGTRAITEMREKVTSGYTLIRHARGAIDAAGREQPRVITTAPK